MVKTYETFITTGIPMIQFYSHTLFHATQPIDYLQWSTITEAVRWMVITLQRSSRSV